MITVVYHRDRNRVEVEGHAYSGEAGHDLVCASASILTHTLATLAKNMENAGTCRVDTSLPSLLPLMQYVQALTFSRRAIPKISLTR